MNWLTRFLTEDSAATAVEYAVMLSLILMAVFATVAAMGQALGAKYTNIEAQITAHGG
jgi:Flp pilus assembly pilin Flp